MLCVTSIIIDNSFIGSTHEMANKKMTLPSDPEFLLQFMDDIDGDEDSVAMLRRRRAVTSLVPDPKRAEALSLAV